MQEVFVKKPLLASFRSVLKFEFERRNKKNKSYSMRAFSRDLGIAPSRLSEIFSGKQGLSPLRARTIGEKLEFKNEKLDWFCNLVAAESSRSRHLKNKAIEKLAPFQNGVLAQELILNLPFEPKWYHFAIRRLTQISCFKSNPSWISEQLTLPLKTTKKAIQEMLQIGMLSRGTNDELIITENYTNHPSSNQKNSDLFFKTMLKKAFDSRKQYQEKQRKHDIHFFSIDTKQIPEIKELIEEFKAKLDHLTYQSEDHDALYATIINLFPMNKMNKP